MGKTKESLASEASDGRLENRVYDELLERIHSGTYVIGDKLPTENDLAAEFSVSRPVIRAALARLRDDGLIVSRRGAGSFVDNGATQHSQGFTPLRSIADISAYWDYRKLIESEAAARAALMRNDAQLLKLRQIHHELGVAAQRHTSTVELNMKLHLLIVEMAGNYFFKDTLRLLTPHMAFVGKFMRSLSSETYHKIKGTMHQEHDAIVRAIEKQDPDAARKAMAAHIESSNRRVFKGG